MTYGNFEKRFVTSQRKDGHLEKRIATSQMKYDHVERWLVTSLMEYGHLEKWLPTSQMKQDARAPGLSQKSSEAFANGYLLLVRTALVSLPCLHVPRERHICCIIFQRSDIMRAKARAHLVSHFRKFRTKTEKSGVVFFPSLVMFLLTLQCLLCPWMVL